MKRPRDPEPSTPNKVPRRGEAVVDKATQDELLAFQGIAKASGQGPLYKYLCRKQWDLVLPEARADGVPTGWSMLTSYVSPGGKLTYVAYLHDLVKRIVDEAKAMHTLSAGNAEAIAAQVASYKPEPPADGELRVVFLNVGSGDCILVRTPGGNVIGIDCGTRARADAAQGEHVTAALKDFLGANSTLFALILTHPDQDHHKDVSRTFFGGKHPAATKCLHLFYSLSIGNYADPTHSCISKRVTGGAIASELRIRTDGVGVGATSVPADDVATLTDEYYKFVPPVTAADGTITGGHVQILGLAQATDSPARKALPQWKEKDCEIYLLAAGVGQTGNLPGDPNPASIVTLIKVHGRKILLTGDAEVSTEGFLLARHADLIQDIDLLHVEHHGAGTLSHASPPFVAKVDPRVAVISSGLMDHNPRWNLLDKYVGGARLCREVDEHTILFGIDNETWCDAKGENQWNGRADPAGGFLAPNYRRHAIYTTNASGDMVFSVDKAGKLWRKWSVGDKSYRYELDGAGNYAVYKVAPDGTRTALHGDQRP